MILKEEREEIIEYGKKLVERGLVVGTFGNLSIYNSKEKLMALTPSGMDYDSLKPEDIVILTPDGEHVDGDKKPSSEYDLHRIFYQRRPDEINAVVHTHSTYCTTLACLNWEIEPIHYLVGYAGGNGKIPCTKYVQFGTYELAESVYDAIGNGYACLMGNHGFLSCGKDMQYAFDIAEQIEFVAQLYYRAKVAGDPVNLDPNQVASLLETFENYAKRQTI